MFRGLMSFIIMGLLIALLVMAIMALRRGAFQGAGRYTPRSDAPVSTAARSDPALDEVRMRYARGEINRDEYRAMCKTSRTAQNHLRRQPKLLARLALLPAQ